MLVRLPSETYLHSSCPPYLDSAGLHSLYDKLAFQAHIALVGPKGIGKSLSVRSWAIKNKTPIVTYDCSEDVRRSNLIGSFVMRGDQTPFLMGPIPTAFEVANELGSCVLVLEELNSCTPQIQKVLNPLLDFRGRLEVPEVQLVCELKPCKKLWVVGTMNCAYYSGVNDLNEDLKSRLRLLRLDYPDKDNEALILTKALNGKAKPDEGILKKLLTLAHESRQGKAVEYSLSTRDLLQFLEDLILVGLPKALWILGGKFEDEDRAWYGKRVESIFEIRASNIK